MEHHSSKNRKLRPLRIFCLGAAIVAALVLIGKAVICFLVTDLFNGMTRSVGIIGGADGPTSIFITTSVTDRVDGSFFFWLGVLIIGIVGYVLLKRRNRKEDDK